MKNIVRIGTRNSTLAIWQAKQVQARLRLFGQPSELVYIQTLGDNKQDVPLHKLGSAGAFTKEIDTALINEEIDLAIHSCKDLPGVLDTELTIGAVLERGSPWDSLVYKGQKNFLENCDSQAVIATGSIRRRAQWLSKYPNHTIVDLRGNVEARLSKFSKSNWNGAILAQAGWQRINIQPEKVEILKWMVPAPAQGVISIVVLKKKVKLKKSISKLSHIPTEMTTVVERSFLRVVEGGCEVPLGGIAVIDKWKVKFKGILHNGDGSASVRVNLSAPLRDYKKLGQRAAGILLEKGGSKIRNSFKQNLSV